MSQQSTSAAKHAPHNKVVSAAQAAAHIRDGATVATAGFLIYLADATGYLGSVALLLFKNFAVVDLPWLPFFTGAAYATSLAGLVLVGGSALLFLRGRRDGVSST
jgi:hypothetical protein